MWTISVFCLLFLAAHPGFCRPGKSAYDSFPKMIQNGVYAPRFDQYRVPVNYPEHPSTSVSPMELENLVEIDDDYEFLVPPSKNYRTIWEEDLFQQEPSSTQLMDESNRASTPHEISNTATSTSNNPIDGAASSAEDAGGIIIRIISMNGKNIGPNDNPYDVLVQYS